MPVSSDPLQTLRLNLLLDVAAAHEKRQIEADRELVQIGSSVLGSIVTQRGSQWACP